MKSPQESRLPCAKRSCRDCAPGIFILKGRVRCQRAIWEPPFGSILSDRSMSNPEWNLAEDFLTIGDFELQAERHMRPDVWGYSLEALEMKFLCARIPRHLTRSFFGPGFCVRFRRCN